MAHIPFCVSRLAEMHVNNAEGVRYRPAGCRVSSAAPAGSGQLSAPQAQHSIEQPAQHTPVLPPQSSHEQRTTLDQPVGAAALPPSSVHPLQPEARSMQPAPHAQALKGRSTGPVLHNASFGGAPAAAAAGLEESGLASRTARAGANGNAGRVTQDTNASAHATMDQQANKQAAQYAEPLNSSLEASAKVALLHQHQDSHAYTTLETAAIEL